VNPLSPDLDPKQVAAFLLSLSGRRILHSVYKLSDQLRRGGYPDAAAKWHQIADLISEMVEESQLLSAATD
jgi:hypothetical protein